MLFAVVWHLDLDWYRSKKLSWIFFEVFISVRLGKNVRWDMFWEVLVGFSSVQKSCDPAGWRFGDVVVWRSNLRVSSAEPINLLLGFMVYFLFWLCMILNHRAGWSTLYLGGTRIASNQLDWKVKQLYREAQINKTLYGLVIVKIISNLALTL